MEKRIQFDAQLKKVNTKYIICLPTEISNELPSRGMLMIQVEMNGHSFILPLEPDGKNSHWFELPEDLITDPFYSNDFIFKQIQIQILDHWPRPEIPEDVFHMLTKNSLSGIWDDLTTKAQWEWIRWIRFTQNPDTRAKRIRTACSMLEAGKKRPCCFDHSRCTIPDVSKSGILNA